MVPLPEDPHLLRRLDEIERLGREEQLAWTTRPTAGHRAEGALAATHQFIVHSHLCGRPGLQIGILGIGQALDVPRAGAAWALPAWIGCRFGRLIVEIVRRQANPSPPIWVRSPDGRRLPLNRQPVEATAEQPAEICGGEV